MTHLNVETVVKTRCDDPLLRTFICFGNWCRWLHFSSRSSREHLVVCVCIAGRRSIVFLGLVFRYVGSGGRVDQWPVMRGFC